MRWRPRRCSRTTSAAGRICASASIRSDLRPAANTKPRGLMTFENILTETRGRVAIVRLNRPQRLNALNDALAAELKLALAAFDHDDAIGAVVITGDERAFAAGADIGAMAEWDMQKVYADNYIMGWESVRETRKPVIAAVAGYAL